MVKGSNEEINTNANRLLRIHRIKNMAEYEERLVYGSEAEKAMKDCERFYPEKRLVFPMIIQSPF